MFMCIIIYQGNNVAHNKDININNKVENLPGIELNNNTKLIYKQSSTKSGSGGCIWSTLYVYLTGNNHLIWILEDTINANSGNWIAGDHSNGGSHYSGRQYMWEPCTYNTIYSCYSYMSFNHNGFIPMNSVGYGKTVQTVTYGISYNGGEVVCGTQLSSTYSVEFSYKIPQFEMKPCYHKSSDTETKLSDNCFDSGKPMSVTWYTVATTGTGTESGNIGMCYESYATFAHYGWFYITYYNHVYSKEYASFAL